MNEEAIVKSESTIEVQRAASSALSTAKAPALLGAGVEETSCSRVQRHRQSCLENAVW